MHLQSCQERGGRKGGLPIREETLVSLRTGFSAAPAGDKKMTAEKREAVAAILKRPSDR